MTGGQIYENEKRFHEMAGKIQRLFPEAWIEFSHDRRQMLLDATIHARTESCVIHVDYFFQVENWEKVAPFYKKYVERSLVDQLGRAELARIWRPRAPRDLNSPSPYVDATNT